MWKKRHNSEQSPQDTAEWLRKGVILCTQGKFDEAITCFDKAIKLDPQNAEVWHNKGLCLIKLEASTEEINRCLNKSITFASPGKQDFIKMSAKLLQEIQQI